MLTTKKIKKAHIKMVEGRRIREEHEKQKSFHVYLAMYAWIC